MLTPKSNSTPPLCSVVLLLAPQYVPAFNVFSSGCAMAYGVQGLHLFQRTRVAEAHTYRLKVHSRPSYPGAQDKVTPLASLLTCRRGS